MPTNLGLITLVSDQFYKNLEDKFRGDNDLVKRRLSIYAPFLENISSYTNSNKIIDLGCGRGEWIEMSKSYDVIAVGVDLDVAMIADATKRGLFVVRSEAIQYLKGLDNESVGLITGFHIIEHLSFTHVQDLLVECNRCLAPGGIIIFETPNPENISIGTCGFYTDPTHKKPLPPELLKFIVDQLGFVRSNILRLNEDVHLNNKKSIALADVICGVSPDYSVIAQKNIYKKANEIDVLFEKKIGLTLENLAHEYDRNIRELTESAKYAIHKFNELAASLKEQGEWVLEFSQLHEMELAVLNSRVSKHDEKFINIESGSLIKVSSFIKNKLKELYWTVTRILGFSYLHDGTAREKANIEEDKFEHCYGSLPVKDKNYVFNLSLLRIESALQYWSDKKTTSRIENSPLKLAFITPFLPQKTGVADYSNELVPFLANHYDVIVISENCGSFISQAPGSIEVRSVEWFENHAYTFDRLIYQFGNSEFHSFMLPLIKKFPGVLVLHDFFLGHLVGYLDNIDMYTGIWNDELYRSEGYGALVARSHPTGDQQVLQDCPVNFTLLQQSLGVIFHNRYSLDLLVRYYDKKYINHSRIVPHGRIIPSLASRSSARNKIDIDENDFVICSFGYLGPHKLSSKIFESWKRVWFSKLKSVKLVFVGEASESIYCEDLIKDIESYGGGNVRITGYVSKETYSLYLASCDLAIQLRVNSRGETSGATLDCMSAGIPTIVCDHGPFSEIPDDCVIKLSEPVSTNQIATAIVKMYENYELRIKLKEEAINYVKSKHSFSEIAPVYAHVIEDFYLNGPMLSNLNALSDVAKRILDLPVDGSATLKYSEEMCRDFDLSTPKKQLLVDVSAFMRVDLNTGVQRVVKCQLKQLLNSPPEGFRIEPIYLVVENGHAFFRYANKLTLEFLGLENVSLDDRAISFDKEDIYYMPDLCYWSVSECQARGLYDQMSNAGVNLNFVVFDNLPILAPDHFPEGASQTHRKWLEALLVHADRLICISDAVKDDILKWIIDNNPAINENLKVDVLHLGFDFNSEQTGNVSLNPQTKWILDKISNKVTFLMVGTIEPRKGYLQVLDAFDKMWMENYDVNLIIVGSEGWKGLEDDKRRTIPLILDRINRHSKLNKNLFWLSDADDIVLHELYSVASCFLMASENEGFGLPLVEALHYNLPIVARDIPVFREILGNNATFFVSNDGIKLAEVLINWLNDYKSSALVKRDHVNWITWKQNVEELMHKLTYK